jgi:demethylmenaquinone methyltransferase/2-methoxy-6-polyprenyl-1,4-benzoquinol methylase
MAANLEQAVEHYRGLAPRYDYYTRRINGIRERAIAALQLRPGDTVVDAGCGTGWCLPRLARAVGAGGRVLAFDPSPEMLEVARSRPRESAAPIDLIRSSAEDVVLPARADAILFSYTHDLIRSPRALANLFRQVKPGARVAATSTKLYAPWLFPANWYLRVTHRAYITNFDGFETPWSVLATLLDDFRVETSGRTQHYVATGRVRPQEA